MDSEIGKKAETKLKEWLDRPNDGYAFIRLYDQMSGYLNISKNPCDFIVYCYPYCYFIESKATYHDRFDFSMIQPHQMDGLLAKSKIEGCFGLVTVLFVTYKRAFIFDIRDIYEAEHRLKKKMSVNIHDIEKWVKLGVCNKRSNPGMIPYIEIPTVPNNRKKFLDYHGELEDLVVRLQEDR